MTDAPIRRLPVDLVIRRSFAFAWESRAVFAGPFAIFAILSTGADLILITTDRSAGELAAYILNGAEEVFAMAFAVGIHRYVLLAEAPKGARFFRWDRHFIQYLLMTLVLLLLGIFAALPALGVVSGAAGPPASGAVAASALFGLAFAVTAAVILARLALSLPSAAIGDGATMRAIWQATHRNGGRLLAAMFMTVLPFILIQAGLIGLLPGTPAGAAANGAEILVTIVWGVIAPVQLIVVTVMLSLCYDALVRGGGPPVVAPGR
jgi:hypothetical protein